MIKEIPAMRTPEWLKEFVAKPDKDASPFPLREILNDSLYYPACQLDWRPVDWMLGNVFSFVYADYDVSRSKIQDELLDSQKENYELIFQRDVKKNELVPANWKLKLKAPMEDIERLNNREASWFWGASDSECFPTTDETDQMHTWNHNAPFANWSIWKDHSHSSSTEPRIFSFLFLRSEAISTYEALYSRTKIQPRIFTIIRPGDGLGWGWSPIRSDDSLFKKVIKSNFPKYLLCEDSDNACWTEYKNLLTVIDDTERDQQLGLWTCKNPPPMIY